MVLNDPVDAKVKLNELEKVLTPFSHGFVETDKLIGNGTNLLFAELEVAPWRGRFSLSEEYGRENSIMDHGRASELGKDGDIEQSSLRLHFENLQKKRGIF